MRLLLVIASAGAFGAGASVATVEGGSGAAPEAAPPTTSEDAGEAPRARATAIVLVRRHGGLPARAVQRLRRTRGVVAVTRLPRGHALLRASRGPGGAAVDRVRPGYAIPLDALVADPRIYRRYAPAAERRAFSRLRPGTALLSRTSARVRRLEAGGRLILAGGGSLRVAGVVDDDLVRGSEVVLHPADRTRLDVRGADVTVATEDPERVTRRSGRAGLRVAVVAPDAEPPPALGGISRPVDIKASFGEFAVRLPYGDDWIDIDPAWRRRSIVTRRVPILGSVTCHRAIFPPMLRALREVRRRGLARLIHPGDYAGCFAPRRIPGSGTLSLHAWGLAFDINASKNPQFERPRQDPRIVEILERAGFAWGGRWPTATDGMHFELRPR